MNVPVDAAADRHRGALLGGLVGDALAAPFEGWSTIVPAETWETVASATTALAFTDDTAMTLAFAESLIRCGGLDEDDLALGFATWWARAPDAGYSGRTATMLARVRRGESLQAARPTSGRPSNGAAMRVAPAALWAAGRPDETVSIARRSALITHPDPIAVEGACVQAVAVAVALTWPDDQIDDRAFAATFVEVVAAALTAASALEPDTSDDGWHARLRLAADVAERGAPDEIAGRIGTGLDVRESVVAAIAALSAHPTSFPDAVTLAGRLGGDADTIAAMTGAIAGALLGEAAIPDPWIDRTGSGPMVRDLADGLRSSPDQAGPTGPAASRS